MLAGHRKLHKVLQKNRKNQEADLHSLEYPGNELRPSGARKEWVMAGIDKATVVTIAVKDQNEALQWFTGKLDYEKRTDISGPGMRWLAVAPRQQKEIEFLLASWFP